jgi:RsiW-degrading membrane proteinase PrsW (M82 family)
MTSPPQTARVQLPSGDISDRGLRYIIVAGVGVFIFVCALLLILFLGARLPFATLIMASLAAIVPVPVSVMLILWLDRHEREPAGLLIASFLWGAIVAILFSLVINTGFFVVLRSVAGERIANALATSVGAPLVEETAKGAAVVILFLLARHEFNNVVDGIVYGALVGLGFEMSENLLYFGRAHAAGGLAAMGVSFYVRSIMGALGHSIYTAATGAGLGYAREAQGLVPKILAPIAGYAAAVIMHALWNGTGVIMELSGLEVHPLVDLLIVLPGMALLYTLPAIVGLVAIAAGGWKREVRVIAESLRDEVERGTVTAAEIDVLCSWRERMRRLLGALAKDPGAWLALRQLYELQVDLGYRKWHAARGERLMSFQQIMTEDEYRARIGTLRQRLDAMGVATA